MKTLLDRFQVIRTRDANEMRAALVNTYRATELSIINGETNFDAVINYARLTHIGLSFCTYGSAVRVQLPEADHVRLQFGISGRAKTISRGVSANVDSRFCAVVNGNTSATYELEENLQQVVLRIPIDLIDRKFATIVGGPLNHNLVFDAQSDLNNSRVQQLKSTVWFLIQSLDEHGTSIPSVALAEIEQMLATTLLFCVPHSASKLIEEPAENIAPWQVTRVEEYLEANWSQPVTIEHLAGIINASARSIFKAFADHRGYSPMEFLRGVRLSQARKMLQMPEPTTSVTAVGLACGFVNLGHFSRHYQQKFGERPSDTLARAKSAKIG